MQYVTIRRYFECHSVQPFRPLLGAAVGQRLQHEGGLPQAEGSALRQTPRMDKGRQRLDENDTLLPLEVERPSAFTLSVIAVFFRKNMTSGGGDIDIII